MPHLLYYDMTPAHRSRTHKSGQLQVKIIIIEHQVLLVIQVNLDMTDSMGPGKLVRHMQNTLYTCDEYLMCIGLGPSIWSVICKNLSYSGPSYPSSPVP